MGHQTPLRAAQEAMLRQPGLPCSQMPSPNDYPIVAGGRSAKLLDELTNCKDFLSTWWLDGIGFNLHASLSAHAQTAVKQDHS